MKIKYWTSFSKRKNSTKQPSGGTELEVTLRKPCRMETPVFILDNASAFDIDYVEAFGHYYYVTDKIHLDNNRVQVECTQDVLATYKSSIGATTALIARSSSNYNKYLKDDYVSTYATTTSDSHDSFTMPFSATGCYIVSVVNKLSSANGYVCSYIMDEAKMAQLAEWLSGDGTYVGDPWATIQSELFLQFGDCFSCVRGVKWVPVDYATAQSCGTSDNVYIGKYYTGFNAYKVTSNTPLVDSSTLDLTDIIPDDFRAAAPYSSVDVYLPLRSCFTGSGIF